MITSPTRFIAATIKVDFSKESIKDILSRGEELGFIYYKYDLDELSVYSNSLTVEQALESIYRTYSSNIEMYNIIAKINELYFNLNFMEDDCGNLEVMFPS